jgi:DNA-binding NtrC family response regulator
LPVPALAALLFGEAGLARQIGKGTQYLREVGRLPRDLQLRLSDRLREGDEGTGLRTLAGCTEDPIEAVRAGRLLEELYYALGPLVITLPPLRERREDLPALVERLLTRAGGESDHRAQGLTAEAWEVVRAYPWPGNLCELYAVLQSACRRAPGEWIDANHLPASLRLAVRLDQTAGPEAEKPLPLKQLLQQAERRLILLALRKSQGNRSRAAELLAVWRPYLLRRMEALGITEW